MGKNGVAAVVGAKSQQLFRVLLQPVHSLTGSSLFHQQDGGIFQFSGNVLQIEQFCEAKTEPAQEKGAVRPVPFLGERGQGVQGQADGTKKLKQMCFQKLFRLLAFSLRQIEGRVQLVGINFNLGEVVQQRFGFLQSVFRKAESSQPYGGGGEVARIPAGAYLAVELCG